MIAPRPRRLRDESGLSLTEVLVAAMLSMIVLIAAGVIFAQTARITTGSNATQQSTRVAANATNALSQTIRMAFDLPVSGSTTDDPAIVAGTSSSLTIYSTSDTVATAPAPSKFTYTLTSGTLTETRCTGVVNGATWTFATCSATTTRTVASGLLTGSGIAPLFAYSANGTAVDPGTGSLTLAQRAAIDAITVTVSVGTSSSTAQRAVVSAPIIMVNLDRT